MNQSVRRWIADITSSAHEQLHTHPKIGRLVSPEITPKEYLHILSGFRRVYETVEARRSKLSHWPELSLKRACYALKADCSSGLSPAPLILSAPSTQSATLGMLYALHGAKFGASIIFRNVSQVLPEESHHYFGAGNEPDVWRRLVAALEKTPPQERVQKDLAQAANEIFQAIDLACN